jgi:uncharacterized membrane protein
VPNDIPGNGLGLLRRWTVAVLLALLAFVTVAEVIDSLFFAGTFNTDPAFYGLVGGMVTGLFAVEAITAFRSKE